MIMDQNYKDAVVIEVKKNLRELVDCPDGIVDSGSSGQTSAPSIYKIPEFMREIKPKAFEPQLVSFGPYHHGKRHLVWMELEKLKAFHRFKTFYQLEVESIVESVSSILEDLWRSYDKLEDGDYHNDAGKFLQLMIVDGCFMLEFFQECPLSLVNMSGDIRRDILLLENQLPMQLLHRLYALANKNDQQYPSQDEDEDQGLKSLVCKSICIPEDGLNGKWLHILDMYRAALLNPSVDRKERSVRGKMYEQLSDAECQIIPPATQLREAGVQFKRSKFESLMDVSFDPKRGVLSLPQVAVDDDTEPTLLNVMAFEKLHVGAGSKVTSFVILMNNLIDADKDVALLASEKILANALGNDQCAAELFSLLGNGATVDLDSHIRAVHKMVNEHCNRPWNKWCASLKHDYFQNPWAIISLVAASLGFALLILQAVYQICEFYR